MSLSKLFCWIYQLTPGKTLMGMLLCALVFWHIKEKLEDKKRWRDGLVVLLTVWAATALWGTVLCRSGGMAEAFRTMPFHSYREILTTGNREILRSNAMNVVLFYPAGLFFAAVMPEGWSAVRRSVVTAAVFAAFSLAIEAGQYSLFLGQGEIDDVIHNTLGAWIGCMTCVLESKLVSIRKKE